MNSGINREYEYTVETTIHDHLYVTLARMKNYIYKNI